MSSDRAIVVDGLTKTYRLGSVSGTPSTLKEAIAGRLRQPFRRATPRHDFVALDNVSFDVRAAEMLGIIGRNGAGKSTLFKILSRITTPDRGHVEIAGTLGCLLEVGTGFHPELTGRENIYLNGTILGMKRREIVAHFDEIVDFAEIRRFLDTPVKRYSSGMYVRLAFAIAAHLDTEILMVDEVLAVGDVAFQERCFAKLEEVHGQGRTVVIISHNMAAIERLAPRCVYLDEGRVVFDGATRDALAAYLKLSQPTGSHVGVGQFEIAGRENPHGDRPLLRHVTLTDAAHQAVDLIGMGDGLDVIIDVAGIGGLDDPMVGLRIRTDTDQLIAGLNTGMQAVPVGLPGHDVRSVTFAIPRLNLTPGRYWIDVGIADKGGQVHDLAPRAASFTIVTADVYGSGYDVSLDRGMIYVDFTCDVRSAYSDAPNDPTII